MSMLNFLGRMVLMMAMLWSQQIMLGKAAFSDVPRLLKDKVKALLVDSGCADLADAQIR